MRTRTPLIKGHGFALIEVLITLVILAFGLLGLAGMESVGLRNSTGSHQRSQAVVLAYDIIDRMRSNCPDALSGLYATAIGTVAPTGTNMPQLDLQRWKTALSLTLVGGDGSVVLNNLQPPTATVTVQWDDSRSTGGSATRSIVVTGALPALATCQGV